MAPKMLVDKDEKGRWYFTRGKYAAELLDDMGKEHKSYLNWLLTEDAGHMSLDARKAIEDRIEELS